MEEFPKVIANPMLALEAYQSEIDEEERINGDDMFYDEVIKKSGGV